jgi:hypothetical protein
MNDVVYCCMQVTNCDGRFRLFVLPLVALKLHAIVGLLQYQSCFASSSTFQCHQKEGGDTNPLRSYPMLSSIKNVWRDDASLYCSSLLLPNDSASVSLWFN